MSLLMEALKKAERAKQGQPPAPDRNTPEQTSSNEREIPTLLASDFELAPHAAPGGPGPTTAEKSAPIRAEPTSASANPFRAEPRVQSYASPENAGSLNAEAQERSQARSVFTAKRPTNSRKLKIAGISLIIGAGIAGSIFFYWPAVSALILGQAPQAAVPSPRTTTPAAPPPPATPAALPAATPAPATLGADNTQTGNTPAAILPDTGKDTASVLPPTTKRKTVRNSHPRSPAAIAPGPANDELETAEPTGSAQSPTRSGSKPSREKPAVQFRQNATTVQVNPTLSGAYQSFTSGNLDMAQQQYQKVLRQEPNSRDALLGLAAVAVNRQQPGQAAAYYDRLLELDPSDPDAMAGMVGVQGQADPVQSESRLKKMLAQNPQAGALYFALGNLYSQQSRWAEAQQAYFRAYSCTPANADYAFNLAISLEHLNQSKLALNYYQRALAQPGPADFDKTLAQSRIRELQHTIPHEPQPVTDRHSSGPPANK